MLIHILDVNDNRPQPSSLRYSGSVLESAPLGSPVLDADGHPLVVRATDEDDNRNGRLMFSIVETTAGRFLTVDPDSGECVVYGWGRVGWLTEVWRRHDDQISAHKLTLGVRDDYL